MVGMRFNRPRRMGEPCRIVATGCGTTKELLELDDDEEEEEEADEADEEEEVGKDEGEIDRMAFLASADDDTRIHRSSTANIVLLQEETRVRRSEEREND